MNAARPELTLLSQEIHNRFRACPAYLRRDPIAELVRITVEVTREFMEHQPEGVDEFLRLCAGQPRGVH